MQKTAAGGTGLNGIVHGGTQLDPGKTKKLLLQQHLQNKLQTLQRQQQQQQQLQQLQQEQQQQHFAFQQQVTKAVAHFKYNSLHFPSLVLQLNSRSLVERYQNEA